MERERALGTHGRRSRCRCWGLGVGHCPALPAKRFCGLTTSHLTDDDDPTLAPRLFAVVKDLDGQAIDAGTISRARFSSKATFVSARETVHTSRSFPRHRALLIATPRAAKYRAHG